MTRKTNKTSKKNTNKRATVIFEAWNSNTRTFERVTSTDEVEPNEMVMPMFWSESDNRYYTIPGTEVYGYVPQY